MKEKDLITAYNSIMHRLTLQGHKVNLQIIDNKVSEEHKRVIEEYWKITYQLVFPEVHRRNAVEPSIVTFKYHFLAILAGIDDA